MLVKLTPAMAIVLMGCTISAVTTVVAAALLLTLDRPAFGGGIEHCKGSADSVGGGFEGGVFARRGLCG